MSPPAGKINGSRQSGAVGNRQSGVGSRGFARQSRGLVKRVEIPDCRLPTPDCRLSLGLEQALQRIEGPGDAVAHGGVHLLELAVALLLEAQGDEQGIALALDGSQTLQEGALRCRSRPRG
jgi:hypothetical protein